MLGSGLAPGPQSARGVASSGGAAGFWVATVSGVWPLPWLRAPRSLIGPSGPWAAAGATSSRVAETAISVSWRAVGIVTR